MNINKNNAFIYLLVIALVVGSFIIGSLWTKVKMMEKGQVLSKNEASNALKNNPTAPVEPIAKDVDPVTDKDWVRGDRGAKLALIEYSDLECPFCKNFHETVQRLMEEYNGQVMWVYRHFPLEQLHSKAPKEAEAAECAGKLGGEEAFWQYIDKIFEVTPANNGLDLALLPDFAVEIGLNQAGFQTCLDSGETADLVSADYDSGVRAGVTGTPGNILLNTETGETKLIPGAIPLDQLKSAVDAMLN